MLAARPPPTCLSYGREFIPVVPESTDDVIKEQMANVLEVTSQTYMTECVRRCQQMARCNFMVFRNRNCQLYKVTEKKDNFIFLIICVFVFL